MEPLLPAPAPLRPQLITDLGVLSFINTGLFLLLYGLCMLVIPMIQSLPREEFDAQFAPLLNANFEGAELEDMRAFLDVMYEHGAGLMFILFLRTGLRLTGVLGMWRGRMWGFHVYAAAQLTGIFAPHLFLPWKFMGIGGPLLAVAMTAVYGTQRRFLS
jgi:hypothetical protein